MKLFSDYIIERYISKPKAYDDFMYDFLLKDNKYEMPKEIKNILSNFITENVTKPEHYIIVLVSKETLKNYFGEDYTTPKKYTRINDTNLFIIDCMDKNSDFTGPFKDATLIYNKDKIQLWEKKVIGQQNDCPDKFYIYNIEQKCMFFIMIGLTVKSHENNEKAQQQYMSYIK
jgi:hypothetical protein